MFRFGSWQFDRDQLALVHLALPYFIPLDESCSAHDIVECLAHMITKLSAEDLGNLVCALHYYLDFFRLAERGDAR